MSDPETIAANKLFKQALAEAKRVEEQRRTEIIDLARSENPEVAFDDDAKLSEGEDNGCYVQAWVWVSFADTKFDNPKEGA